MKNYLVEFIGTFFLVLVIGMCVISPGAGVLTPIAIGLTLMVMVYAGGPISGGHFNPAVTLAVLLRGKCASPDAGRYMLAQFLAGGAAGHTALFLRGWPTVSPVTLNVPAALVAEVLFTFALAYVVLNTATSKKNAGNSYFGLAIGSTVIVGAIASSGISGGVLNPAVALGLTAIGICPVQYIWIFLVANFLGGYGAAIVYKAVNPDEFETPKRKKG